MYTLGSRPDRALQCMPLLCRFLRFPLSGCMLQTSLFFVEKSAKHKDTFITFGVGLGSPSTPGERLNPTPPLKCL